MRIFEQSHRINFVDEADVLVGFDWVNNCCENFGYFFTSEIPNTAEIPSLENPDAKYLKPSKKVLEEFNFDSTFFLELSGDSWEAENVVVFRLVGPSPFGDNKEPQKELFLSLYNRHNGYYSHGFDVKVGGTVLRRGSL